MKRHLVAALLLGGCGAAAIAQTRTEPDARVEVTGQRAGDVEARRESTAAMIVIGRDEIERYGDSSLGELFKRLPGVTVQGSPRRGGSVRMRGLGGGYTQILLDGERVPANFSIDSIAPEQIDRIEVLRAPTAETGARAIAGTINIVTREAATRRSDEVRVALGHENGRYPSSASWARSDRAGALAYGFTLSAADEPQDRTSLATVTDTRLADGMTTFAQSESARTREGRRRVNLGGRLQWRDDSGDGLTLTPLAVHSETRTQRDAQLQQSIGPTPPLYDLAASDGTSRSSQLRLSARWRQSLGEDSRLDLRGSLRESRGSSHSLRRETSAAGTLLRRLDDSAETRDRSTGLSAKLSHALGDDHQLVAGLELEASRRSDARTTLQDGLPLLLDFGDELRARSRRTAAYLQDEWMVSPRWTVQGGLRWERLVTRGDSGSSATSDDITSRVASPLVHLLWKPGERRQVRLAMTRSYRSPSLQSLLARPALSTRFPVPGPNLATSPDRAGNPALKPERARGIDLAFEQYLAGGGLLGVNLFHRRIKDLMRSLTTLEPVPWATVPRWVSRPVNIGDASASGIELEAKGRLDALWPGAPRLGFQANASVFRSRVRSVPGPDNRLDEQPKVSLNLGVDYRLRSLPLAWGMSVNHLPAYETRLSDVQTALQGRRTQIDAYALWTIDDRTRLRLSLANADPIELISGGSVDSEGLREVSRNVARSERLWQLRLEIKL